MAETISSSAYAKRCKEVMRLYDELQALNVQADFNSIIPRVVVIGSQSSGKSSLVEAVSGINVPRDSGTCTRCPMECRMYSVTPETPWSCEISIRKEYDQSGKKLPVTHSQAFGSRITNKSEVELWIRRAQAAVLSPHRDPSDFEIMPESEVKANASRDKMILQFSKNVVVIKVCDPEATDLSFVDLPGLIQNAMDENLITTVKGLVEHYIRGKSTVIVIAMPVTDDYENLQAVTIAKHKDADPDGSRTIGVLTKPDMLGENNIGARKNWKEVLEGSRHATTHGYFAVRLPDDIQRAAHITREKVQQNADSYFSSTVPWSDMDDRSRFGIPNFVAYVSQLLIDLIEKSLPLLRIKVEEKLLQYLAEMENIPPLPKGHPSTEVLMRINNFCRAVNDAVFGEKYKHFVQVNLITYSTFKEDIVSTAPEFRPFEGSASELETRRRCTSCSKIVDGAETETRGIDVVRNRIKMSIDNLGVTRAIPFEVTKNLLRDYIDLWAEPIASCLKKSNVAFKKLLSALLDEHFGQYKFLKRYICDLVLKQQEEHREDAATMLQKILRMEKIPLYTQNTGALATEKSIWKASLQEEANRVYPVGYNSSGHRCSSNGFRRNFIKYRFKPEATLSEGDRPTTWTVNDEFDIMAGVQAYFHVAHQRIIDYVPLTIEHELHQNFAESIGNVLIEQVMQDTGDRKVTFDQLLSEDPVIASKRKELQDSIDRLQKIKTILDEFKHLEPLDAASVSDGGTDDSILTQEAGGEVDSSSDIQEELPLRRAIPVEFIAYDTDDAPARLERR